MGKRESRDGDDTSGSVPEDLPEEPRTQASRRESQENTAPLHTAGYADELDSNAESHRGQTQSEEERKDVDSALSGRLNPIGGGE